ncbi:LOW QUALITY PROTEIN: ADP-ribosylhydrolase ARH3-like [Acipenser ruthenus]|uniref:ADP-ribosylhydrolase ARH3 n=1 Tax=Acipenser ruthenus TaxID=7906 RepID=UPI001560F0B6|nr:ADP-ribosylhydrolase ARH3 [Acipenser ruthenus]XP_058875158.1 LOW QUALITY PROTEIN: ADP-ribosylhydrolase ARH3-like [Acipenser ruthenus]
MSAVLGRAGAAGPSSLSRFRGALVGALLGDCVGAEFEGTEEVPLDRVLQHLDGLEEESRGDGILQYSDDTAMTRCVVQSLLSRSEFDVSDLGRRFAEEYRRAPLRGYGAGVVQVFKKLLSPRCADVLQPAREQFGGRGSFGNGGAMRAAPIALAYPQTQDVIEFSRRCALLTHASSLGYNGAVLQALAVHFALRGALCSGGQYLELLIGEMESLEREEKALSDARELNEADFPYCTRLRKVKEMLERSDVSVEEVVMELGNGIAALHSVPTAIFCALHCLSARPSLPPHYSGVQRTLAFSLALGGDTDTIATMAGAIAGAHYGMEQVPASWQRSCEGEQDAEEWGERLHKLYQSRALGGSTTERERGSEERGERAE